RVGRDSSAPLSVEADHTQRAPRNRAPLKKYGARVFGNRAICRPSGPIRTRPGHESAVPAETSSHATPPGGGISRRGVRSDTRSTSSGSSMSWQVVGQTERTSADAGTDRDSIAPGRATAADQADRYSQNSRFRPSRAGR